MPKLHINLTLQQKIFTSGLLLFAVILSFVFATLFHLTVSAGGAIGDGGDPGSKCEGIYACTDNGWGWYSYPTTGAIKPKYFANKTTTWSYVSNTCSSLGADRVMALIILEDAGFAETNINLKANYGVVYDYEGWSDYVYLYNGKLGTSWVPTSVAKDRYDFMDAAKYGYTWGVNVGWFCFSTNPAWTLSATTTNNKSGTAKEGETILWTNKIVNNGIGITTHTVNSQIALTNFTSGFWGVSSLVADGNTPAGVAVSGVGGYLRVIRYTNDNFNSPPDYSTYVVQKADVGKTLCQKVRFNHKAGAADLTYSYGNDSCVTIVSPWSISVTSSTNVTTAKPGSVITWTHTATNSGANSTNKDVIITPSSGSGSGTLLSGSVPGAKKSFPSTYTVQTSDSGSTLCRATVATPQAWDNSNPITSAPACVTVPLDYNLIPSVTVNPSGVIETGSSFDVATSINNSGTTDNNPTATWTLVKTLSQPGFGAVITSQTGTGLLVPAKSSVAPIATFVDNSTDKLVGTRICYVLSVQPYSSTVAGSTSSAPACVTLGKRPKAQIWGGDLWTGGKVQTSLSSKGGIMFGSWDEYGIFSAGVIDGMASGSAFSGSGLASVGSACDYSYLSFSNVPTGLTSCSGLAGTIGNYAGLRTALDVASSFPGGTAIAGTITPSNLATGTYTVAGDLTLNASTLPASKSIIIKATGTVTINGNQSYDNGPYSSAAQLPQLVITADIINIVDSVTNVDAWLVAKTSINTCSTVAVGAPLTSSMCNQRLVVNGPVSTSQLYLRRTAGSNTGAQSGDPAEIFNLRPDAYLWAIMRSQLTGRVQTVYITELPPRF